MLKKATKQIEVAFLHNYVMSMVERYFQLQIVNHPDKIGKTYSVSFQAPNSDPRFRERVIASFYFDSNVKIYPKPSHPDEPLLYALAGAVHSVMDKLLEKISK